MNKARIIRNIELYLRANNISYYWLVVQTKISAEQMQNIFSLEEATTQELNKLATVLNQKIEIFSSSDYKPSLSDISHTKVIET